MLWQMTVLRWSWWKEPDPCWGNENLTWYGLRAFKNKHKTFKSGTRMFLTQFSECMICCEDLYIHFYTIVYAIQNHDQHSAFFCPTNTCITLLVCLMHFLFCNFCFETAWLCSSHWLWINWPWIYDHPTSGTGITDRRYQTWLSHKNFKIEVIVYCLTY